MAYIIRVCVIASGLFSVVLFCACGGGGGNSSLHTPLSITTTSLPNGIVGSDYVKGIQATGGVAPFHWSVSSGALPHNVTLTSSSSNSVTTSGISDTAQAATSFVIQITDSINQTTSQAYSVAITYPQ